MKRRPLYRAPLAGLMSLALLTPVVPAPADDASPRANEPDDEVGLEKGTADDGNARD
jgi:hypothetical protein